VLQSYGPEGEGKVPSRYYYATIVKVEEMSKICNTSRRGGNSYKILEEKNLNGE
jgi:hypothetical protein